MRQVTIGLLALMALGGTGWAQGTGGEKVRAPLHQPTAPARIQPLPEDAEDAEDTEALRQIPNGGHVGSASQWFRERAPNSTMHEAISLFRTHCPRIAAATTVAEQRREQAALDAAVQRFADVHSAGNIWVGWLLFWYPGDRNTQAALGIQIAEGLAAVTVMPNQRDPHRTLIQRSHPGYAVAAAALEERRFVWLNVTVDMVGASQDDSCRPIVRFKRIERDRGPLAR